MAETAHSRKMEAPGEATDGDPAGEPVLPEAPPAARPVTAGPVVIQVSPQGHVTINVTPPDAPVMPDEAPAVTARGFGEWLRGEETPGDQPAGTGEPGPVQEALDKLRSALKTLGEKVEQFAEDVSTLEVRTYVSDRLDQIDNDAAFFTTAEPRALTHIDFDGDTKVVVPLSAGQLDEALWKVHVETVAQAQAHREAMFRTVMELVRGIVPSIK